MKKTLKKITAMLLTALFMINLLPTSAFAANTGDIVSYKYEVEESASEDNSVRALARYFGKTCPIGVASDYATMIGSPYTHVITLSDRELGELSRDTLSSIFVDIFTSQMGVIGVVVDTFYDAATSTIQANAFADADPNAMSLKITKFKNSTHSIGGNEYFRYVVAYYTRANCTGYIKTVNYYEAITPTS